MQVKTIAKSGYGDIPGDGDWRMACNYSVKLDPVATYAHIKKAKRKPPEMNLTGRVAGRERRREKGWKLY